MNKCWFSSTPGINKFIEEVTDAVWHNYHGYRDVEFNYKGGRYRLVSTGDLYKMDYSGMPHPMRAYPATYKGQKYAIVNFSDYTRYYTKGKKQLRLKDLIWAAFGNRDLPQGHHIICQNDNWHSCGITNLEVIANGISRKRSEI